MGRVLRLFLVPAALAVAFGTIAGSAADSPVLDAVQSGDLVALRALVDSGENVNMASGDGSTPLLWAAYHFDLDMAGVLVGAGAEVDAANNYGVTPLIQAARTGDARMVELLLDAGADPSLAHPDGETPLMAASRAGSVPAVRLLLDRGVDVNAMEAYQHETALMWAGAEGHPDVVDLLLDAGADPDLKARESTLTDRRNTDYPTGGFTALMWAARNGEEETVRRLVEGGADPDLKNGDGASAMVIATYNDRFDLARTLIDLGADVNDGSLYTAVEMRRSTTDQFAFDGSRLRPDNENELTALDLIGLLLDAGADPHQWFAGQFHSMSMPNSDRFANSALFRAAESADAEALRVFAAHGADLDRLPEAPEPEAGAGPPGPGAGRGRGGGGATGRTAAMVAMGGGGAPQMTGGPGYIRSGEAPYREPGSRRAEDAVKALLEGGADPNAKATDGSTLLHQAAQAGNIEIIQALADAGVDFDMPNGDGLTALDLAEGRTPEGAAPPAAARGGAGARGGRGAFGGRGGGGRGGPNAEVAGLIRELMGLPPAPAADTPQGSEGGPEGDAGV